MDLDEKVSGTVKSGDNSLVDIHGRSTVFFVVSGGQHRALTDVYWITWLRSNTVSIGQLDENRSPTHVEDIFMIVHDYQKRIITKAPRARNKYIVPSLIVKPVGLLGHADDNVWLWHMRFRHRHF